jgi:Flp pilus assembly protein protease CpaA
MIEYYFLFAIALVYLIIASYEDVKKTEVANWVTYSFAVFALAYRAVYSVLKGDYKFFLFGVIGFLVFYLIGNLLYYAKALGGADVKLLRGIGAVLPYSGYLNLVVLSLGFIVLLFAVAFVYALVYSIFVVIRYKSRFVREFRAQIKKFKLVVIVSPLVGVLCLILSIVYSYGMIGGAAFLFFLLMPLLYVFLKAVDECMIVIKKPKDLMEGDWILNDIKLKSYIVKNTVHGLSAEDIMMLRRAGRDIRVKNGIPFVPAMLLSFIVMVFFLVVLKLDFLSFLLY